MWIPIDGLFNRFFALFAVYHAMSFLVPFNCSSAALYTLTTEIRTFTETSVADRLLAGRRLIATVNAYVKTGVVLLNETAHSLVPHCKGEREHDCRNYRSARE
jgi:hypothetical protein